MEEVKLITGRRKTSISRKKVRAIIDQLKKEGKILQRFTKKKITANKKQR